MNLNFKLTLGAIYSLLLIYIDEKIKIKDKKALNLTTGTGALPN